MGQGWPQAVSPVLGPACSPPLSDLYSDRTPSPTACQHGSPAPTLAGSAQEQHQATGSPLHLPTTAVAWGPSCHPFTLHWPRGHLFQCRAGCHPQGQPGCKPCGVGRDTADNRLCQAWA